MMEMNFNQQPLTLLVNRLLFDSTTRVKVKHIPESYFITSKNDKWVKEFFFIVVIQDYELYVSPAHVIKGNDVIFKCDVPSFVSDLVLVFSWEDNDNKVYQTESASNLGKQSIQIQNNGNQGCANLANSKDPMASIAHP